MENNIILTQIKVEDLESIINKAVKHALTTNANKGDEKEDDFLSLNEACKFLGLSSSTVYNLVNQRRIPHSKKGKRLFFSKQELIGWVNSGKRTGSDGN